MDGKLDLALYGSFLPAPSLSLFQDADEIKEDESKDTKISMFGVITGSSDEKIKVKLLAPDLRTKEQSSSYSVTMNDGNNLEWKCVLQPKDEYRLPLEYTLEWPRDKNVEFKEQ